MQASSGTCITRFNDELLELGKVASEERVKRWVAEDVGEVSAGEGNGCERRVAERREEKKAGVGVFLSRVRGPVGEDFAVEEGGVRSPSRTRIVERRRGVVRRDQKIADGRIDVFVCSSLNVSK